MKERIKNLFGRLKGSRILKSTAILAGGSFLSQIILAVEHLLVTRIFSVDAIGYYNFLMAIPLACTGIICARYELPIVYDEDEKNVKPLVKLSFAICISLGFIVTLINLFYLISSGTENYPYLWLNIFAFLFILAFGFTHTVNSFCNRYRNYKTISKMHVVRTLAQALPPVVLGLILVKGMGMSEVEVPLLTISYCVGMGVGLLSMGKPIAKDLQSLRNKEGNSCGLVAKKHLRQPLLSTPANFANSFSYSLVTIDVKTLFGDATAGFYSLSAKLLGMPIALISGNLSKVFMEEASKEITETGKYKKSFNKTFLILGGLSIPMFLVMFFFAPPICGFLLGQEWVIAGEYIRILAPMFTVRFIATALSPGLLLNNKQMYELATQVLLLVVTFAAGIFTKIYSLDVTGYLILLCIGRSVAQAVQVFLVFIFSRISAKETSLLSK